MFAIAASLVGLGCNSPPPEFELDLVSARRNERQFEAKLSPEVMQDVNDGLTAMFGTPNDPHVPEMAQEFLNSADIEMAAGAVRSDKDDNPEGLYREHCAHCHGITGNGRGPTASVLNPYPRDFTAGKFKFKSTPKSERPTKEDLRRTLHEGIPGTSMPSFHLLPDNQLDALIEYVMYLSLRGETEKVLYYDATEFTEGRLIDLEQDPSEIEKQLGLFQDALEKPLSKWEKAEKKVTKVAPRDPDWQNPEKLAESIKRGKELFYGAGNCAQCHGQLAMGNGRVTDYDDWTTELEPTNAVTLAENLELGALPPMYLRPRNLRQGVFRGGSRPVDIYLRIVNGIDGTPMPKALIKPTGSPPTVAGITEEDVWSLVDYVMHLPYEPLSNPIEGKPENLRERN
jgi:mono/diheme cytochrome c family protein